MHILGTYSDLTKRSRGATSNISYNKFSHLDALLYYNNTRDKLHNNLHYCFQYNQKFLLLDLFHLVSFNFSPFLLRFLFSFVFEEGNSSAYYFLGLILLRPRISGVRTKTIRVILIRIVRFDEIWSLIGLTNGIRVLNIYSYVNDDILDDFSSLLVGMIC